MVQSDGIYGGVRFQVELGTIVIIIYVEMSTSHELLALFSAIELVRPSVGDTLRREKVYHDPAVSSLISVLWPVRPV